MPHTNQLQARGTVIEIMDHGAYRVELANGHRCIARALGENKTNFLHLAAGDHVQVEFHPYDLSRGRVV